MKNRSNKAEPLHAADQPREVVKFCGCEHCKAGREMAKQLPASEFRRAMAVDLVNSFKRFHEPVSLEKVKENLAFVEETLGPESPESKAWEREA